MGLLHVLLLVIVQPHILYGYLANCEGHTSCGQTSLTVHKRLSRPPSSRRPKEKGILIKLGMTLRWVHVWTWS